MEIVHHGVSSITVTIVRRWQIYNEMLGDAECLGREYVFVHSAALLRSYREWYEREQEEIESEPDAWPHA